MFLNPLTPDSTERELRLIQADLGTVLCYRITRDVELTAHAGSDGDR